MVPPPNRERWLAYRARSAAPRQRLFCLPHAGGGASLFRGWRQHLPDDIEVCPVLLPGRETRFGEAPFTRLDALVSALIEGIRSDLDLPFSLFGHSNGALIAHAAACRLEREGLPAPRLLIASAHRAPHLPEPEPLRHRLRDDELLEDLKRLDGTPPALFESPEMVRLILSVYRADLEVGETRILAPVEPLPCPIAAYGGASDLEVVPSDLGAWRAHSRVGFRSRLFPGGHFYLTTPGPELFGALATDLKMTSSNPAAGARA